VLVIEPKKKCAYSPVCLVKELNDARLCIVHSTGRGLVRRRKCSSQPPQLFAKQAMLLGETIRSPLCCALCCTCRRAVSAARAVTSRKAVGDL
jgi:hypothetical protein